MISGRRYHIKAALLVLLLSIGFTPATRAQLEKIEDYYHDLEKQGQYQLQTIQFVQEQMNLVEDYSKLSQIILLRHGEPALDKKGWRTRKEAVKFVFDYDTVGVYPPHCTPLILQVDELEVIHTSAINRSVSTANQLFGPRESYAADSIFREFERKIFSFPNIVLPLNGWLIVTRVLWFIGLNKQGIETFSQAKARARSAAALLEKDALAQGKCLLVSHGLLNHFLVKYLKKNGWTEVYDGGKGYLSQKMLVRYD